MSKNLKYRAGDTLKQKITGWKVVLLEPLTFWNRNGGESGDWAAKIWIESSSGGGYWEERAVFESELELLN